MSQEEEIIEIATPGVQADRATKNKGLISRAKKFTQSCPSTHSRDDTNLSAPIEDSNENLNATNIPPHDDEMLDFIFSSRQDDETLESQEKKMQNIILQMDPDEMEDRDLDADVLMDAFRLLRQRQAESEKDDKKQNVSADVDALVIPPKSQEDNSHLPSQIHETTTEPSPIQITNQAHPQHQVFQKLCEMMRNGNAFQAQDSIPPVPRYLWSQDRENVIVNVQLPPQTKSRDLALSLEHGMFLILFRGEKYFEKMLAYPVTDPQIQTQAAKGGTRSADDAQSFVDRLSAFEVGGKKALGVADPADITVDLSESWSLHDMEGDDAKSRRVEIEFGKMAPAGLTVWWRRCFEGEPEIDVTVISDRKQGSQVSSVLTKSAQQQAVKQAHETAAMNVKYPSKDEKNSIGLEDFDLLDGKREEVGVRQQELTDDELMKIPVQTIDMSKGKVDFFSYDHVSRERERIEEGMKAKPKVISKEEWKTKFLQGIEKTKQDVIRTTSDKDSTN